MAHYYSDTEGIVAEVIRRRLHEHIVYDHNFPLTQDERQRHLDNVTLANTLSPIELDEQSLNTIIIGVSVVANAIFISVHALGRIQRGRNHRYLQSHHHHRQTRGSNPRGHTHRTEVW